MNFQEKTLFDLDFKVKVTQHFAQFPLHYVSYAPAKIAVASSKSLGGDAFTRNVMDGLMNAHTDGYTDDGPTWLGINIFFFKRKKRV